jgi:glycosyl transferase family 25
MNTGLLTFFAILVIIVLGVCIALITNKKSSEDSFVSQPITNPISNNDVQLYMISLDRIRDKRADKSLPLLKKIFPKGTRFSAVDAENIDISDPRLHPFAVAQISNNTDYDHAHISSMGQVACYLSHVELWKKCIELNEPILVAEDDQLYSDKSLQDILHTYQRIPLDADFASIVYIPTITYGSECKDLWCKIKPRSWYGTHLYYITPKTARILLENALPIITQVDSYINHNIGNVLPNTSSALKTYVSRKNIPFTRSSGSVLKHSGNVKKFLPESNIFWYIFLGIVVTIIISLVILWTRKCPDKCGKRKK